MEREHREQKAMQEKLEHERLKQEQAAQEQQERLKKEAEIKERKRLEEVHGPLPNSQPRPLPRVLTELSADRLVGNFFEGFFFPQRHRGNLLFVFLTAEESPGR